MNQQKVIRLSLLIVLVCSGFIACETMSEDEIRAKGEFASYEGVGVVKAIDVENNKITIKHEAIEGYMSAMTMDFLVGYKQILKTAKVGDKIEFNLVLDHGVVSVRSIEKIGEVAQINASEIYKTNCAKCHGETGEGVKDKGISFLKGHALDHTEEDFIKQVENGKEDEMPSFKDKLSKEEIAEVVKYVRDEIQSKVNPKDKGNGHKH